MTEPTPSRVTSLSQRNLASTSFISSTSYCPTRDLVALLSTSSTTSTTATKVSIYRTTGNADLVTEYIPTPPVVVGSGATAAIGKLGAFANKGKAKVGQSVVEKLCWNPQGTHLALLTSSTSTTTPSSSTIEIVSLSTSSLSLPPISLSSLSGNKITSLCWKSLPHKKTRVHYESSAISLINELPILPTLVKESTTSSTNANESTGGATATGTGVGRAAIFGAKNAMLQREREKEMGKALSFDTSCTNFPTLIDETSQERDEGDEHANQEKSLLIVGDETGKVSLFKDGTVYLGSCRVREGSKIIGIEIVPDQDERTNDSKLSILLESIQSDLIPKTISINLPPMIDAFLLQSTKLKEMLSHAFEALQDVRNLWDEARRIGKGWLTRIIEVSKSHVESTPITQLLMLLLTGRPSAAIHDFLASKMNEKSLTKWEGAMAQVLDRLKGVTFMSLQPAVERVVLLLEEIRAWGMWPEKFGEFEIPIDEVSRCIAVAQEIIKSSARLERIVIEEEKCYHMFAAWLHYELEKMAQQEGSEVRPIANFSPIPVAHYIRHCLPIDTNSILPFLNFGPFNSSIESNADLLRARKWIDELDVREETLGEGEEEKEELERVMRRMKEELKGQVAAEKMGHQDDFSAGGERMERPPKEGAKHEEDIPRSLPVWLHLLAEKIGRIMIEAIGRVGEPKLVEEEDRVLGTAGEGAVVREHVTKDGHLRAWIHSGVLLLARSHHSPSSPLEFASANLRTAQGTAIEVIDFDWLTFGELILIGKIQEKRVTRYALLSADIKAFSWSTPSSQTPMPHLPISSDLTFEPQFPPEGFSLHMIDDEFVKRRVACVLAGEGRRLDVVAVDLVSSEPDEDERMDE